MVGWVAEESGIKANLSLGGSYKLKYVLPFPTRNHVTLGMFNSTLIYCLLVSGGCYAPEIKQLKVLQNKAAQVVTLPQGPKGHLCT